MIRSPHSLPLCNILSICASIHKIKANESIYLGRFVSPYSISLAKAKHKTSQKCSGHYRNMQGLNQQTHPSTGLLTSSHWPHENFAAFDAIYEYCFVLSKISVRNEETFDSPHLDSFKPSLVVWCVVDRQLLTNASTTPLCLASNSSRKTDINGSSIWNQQRSEVTRKAPGTSHLTRVIRAKPCISLRNSKLQLLHKCTIKTATRILKAWRSSKYSALKRLFSKYYATDSQITCQLWVQFGDPSADSDRTFATREYDFIGLFNSQATSFEVHTATSGSLAAVPSRSLILTIVPLYRPWSSITEVKIKQAEIIATANSIR